MHRSGVFLMLLPWSSIAGGATPPQSLTPATGVAAPLEAVDRVVFIRYDADPGRHPSGAAADETPASERNADRPRDGGERSGTGFFVRDGNRTFLVTARHVGMSVTPRAHLSFVNDRRESRMIRLGGLLREPENLSWRHHEKADVSVIQLHPRGEPANDVAALCVERDLLVGVPPARGSQAMACGFFMREGTHERLSPLGATVHVASEVMPVTFDGKRIDAFLVNPPAGSGFSGGPVFWHDAQSGRFRCIGVTSGVIGDRSGGKFSTVMPASTILELIE